MTEIAAIPAAERERERDAWWLLRIWGIFFLFSIPSSSKQPGHFVLLFQLAGWLEPPCCVADQCAALWSLLNFVGCLPFCSWHWTVIGPMVWSDRANGIVHVTEMRQLTRHDRVKWPHPSSRRSRSIWIWKSSLVISRLHLTLSPLSVGNLCFSQLSFQVGCSAKPFCKC